MKPTAAHVLAELAIAIAINPREGYMFPRRVWANQVEACETDLGYWDWVREGVECWCSMTPEEGGPDAID